MSTELFLMIFVSVCLAVLLTNGVVLAMYYFLARSQAKVRDNAILKLAEAYKLMSEAIKARTKNGETGADQDFPDPKGSA